jgi:hypothetical protein
MIALMMEAVQTSETLINSYQSTRQYNPEDSHLQSLIMIIYEYNRNVQFKTMKPVTSFKRYAQQSNE